MRTLKEDKKADNIKYKINGANEQSEAVTKKQESREGYVGIMETKKWVGKRGIKN